MPRAALLVSTMICIGLISATINCGSTSSSLGDPDAGAVTGDDAAVEGADAASKGGAGSTCKPVGVACTAKGDCCSAYCSAGVCSCNSDGYACVTNTDCCASDCSQGVCGGSSSTSPSGPGSLDKTFGTGGCTAVSFAGNPANNSIPNAFGIDINDNIFVVGSTETDGIGDDSASESGWFASLDGHGTVMSNVALSTSIGPVAGLVMAPGTEPTLVAGSGDTQFIRVSTAGVPDPSYTFNLGAFIMSAAYQSTKALIFSVNGHYLARFTPEGTSDSSFGIGDGGAGTLSGVYSMAIDSSDRIYVVGGTVGFARYSANGERDTTFAPSESPGVSPPSGPAFFASSSGNDLYFIAPLDDPYGALWVAHAGPNGFDTSYGGGVGHVLVHPPTSAGIDTSILLKGAAVQDDGSLVIAGADQPDAFFWYLTRLKVNGEIDSSFGTAGWVTPSANSPPGGPGTTVYGPVSVALAGNGGAVVLEKRSYDQNLYSEHSAIVCKYKP